MNHNMKLSEPWFSYVKRGEKKIEGRLYDNKRKLLKIGDTIIFSDENNNNIFEKEIKDLQVFDNFNDALNNVKLEDILPGITNHEDGVDIYNKIPGYSDGSKKYGVILIHF